MQSTLGFAPEVHTKTIWHTTVGQHVFASKVNSNLKERTGTDWQLEFTPEMSGALKKALIHVDNIDQHVNEALRYVTLLYLNRIQMKSRLDHIRENPLRAQPRGCNGRERGDLPHAKLSSSSHFTDFMKEQQKFR